MKAFIIAVVFATIVAVGMSYVLNAFQRDSYVAYSTGAARVGDPGNNLIGNGWNS